MRAQGGPPSKPDRTPAREGRPGPPGCIPGGSANLIQEATMPEPICPFCKMPDERCDCCRRDEAERPTLFADAALDDSDLLDGRDEGEADEDVFGGW